MENQEQLREEIRNFRAKTELPYSFIAKKINMKKQSFYNFMSGSRRLSEEKQKLLKEELRRLS